MRSQALDKAARRIIWIRMGGLALVLILAGRAAHLTVAHTRARNLYDQQIQTEQRLSPARGTIFDRDGRELAITTEAASIYALPRLIEDRPATAAALAQILEIDVERLTARLTDRDGFTYLARWVEATQAERIRELDLRGVGIDREPHRIYPAGKLAAPLLGFANLDGQGVRGIEQIEDAWLTGKPRRVRVERDARGRALALHSTDPREVLGGEIMLTLDAAMQGAAEAALHDAVVESEASGGMVITIDPKNGDVLALAEAPGFDPNRFRDLDYNDTRARAFVDVAEAGSTMKAFLVASALDAGLIDARSEFDTGEGWMRVRGKTIRDAKPHGVIRTADVLRVSSNIGAVQIAQQLGREAQYRGLLRFGFGRSTRSGFPMESPGLVRDWSLWKPVDQATVSFGQGLSVTAIQLASAVAALANDGERMRPRLVMARRRGQGNWRPTPVDCVGQAVSPAAARQTIDMMRTVVSPDGTGRNAGLADVSVAGKTGTAQKLDLETMTYSQDRYIAWFIGVVPANDPELAIVVAVDEPMGRLHSGGGVAAPLFARVAAAQLARRGVVTEAAPIPARPAPVLVTDAVPASDTPSPSVATQSVVTTTTARAEPATRGSGENVEPPLEFAPPEHSEPQRVEEPLQAAVAAPPARPAALPVAAGQSPHVASAPPAVTPVSASAEGPAFVPDFSGQTMSHAKQLAQRESLSLSVFGATNGRVVSQLPVPGTVLDGNDRTVLLEFAQRQEEG
jgi:cell division protein FtsI (penicillin-binding protein 3)